MKKKISAKKKLTKKSVILLSIFIPLIFVFVLNIVILPLTGSIERNNEQKNPSTPNPYITYNTENGLFLSAHRAGGDLAPEETKSAFRLCMEATDYRVDVLEFDLHLTKDNQLVLLHDHKLARTSNGEELFFKNVKVCDLTLAELKTINFGYYFEDPASGEKIYQKSYSAEEIDDLEIGIFSLEEILTFVEKEMRTDKSMHYIIEIKDSGKRGRTSTDILYSVMQKFDIVDRTIVGTFHGDVTNYIDSAYKGKITRSAGIMEMLNFYYAFLWGRNLNTEKLGFRVLQIPMGIDGYFDFSTKAFISYAHKHGIAVQFWTINNEEDIKTLQQNGADCIMTDNPSMAYTALSRQ